MTKQQIRSLALVGYVQKLKQIEAELQSDYKLFPEAFVGGTAPQLLRPELRNGGGHWPIDVQPPARRKYGKRGPYKVKGKMTGDAKRRARREQVKVILDAFGSTPTALSASGFPGGQIGALVRRGYLRKKRGGYVRTRKVFVVDDRKAAQLAAGDA